jgi:hypothetical protein
MEKAAELSLRFLMFACGMFLLILGWKWRGL